MTDFKTSNIRQGRPALPASSLALRHRSPLLFRDSATHTLVCLLQGAILVAALGLPAVAHAVGLSTATHIFVLCLALVATSLWVCCTLPWINRDPFNLYALFFVSMTLFNAGQPMLEIFKLNRDGLLCGMFDDRVLIQTLYLVLLSLNSYHFGGLLANWRRPQANPYCQEHLGTSACSFYVLRLIGTGLIAVSLVPSLMIIVEDLQVVRQYGYFGLFSRERQAGLGAGFGAAGLALSELLPAGLIFSLIGAKNMRKQQFHFFAILVSYSLLQLFLGRRSWGTMTLVSAAWIWHMQIRPLSMKTLLVGGFVMLFVVFPTIRVIRNMEGDSRTSVVILKESFLSIESPVAIILSEMGSSMGCVAHSLELVPEVKPFFFGQSYAIAVTSVIPNFFWDLHPAMEHANLGRWLTKTVAPGTFDSGGGLGFSVIAEAYVNFGWLGAPIVMGLIGFAISRLAVWGASGHRPECCAFVAICMTAMLFWPRADLTIFFRSVMYGAVIPYWTFLFFRSRMLAQFSQAAKIEVREPIGTRAFKVK